MLFLTATLMLAALASDAPASLAGNRATPAAQPLDGVVTNATVSLAGQAFYREFCAFWHDKPLGERFAIAVRERPSARRGNQVAIEYAGRVVFQGALPPTPGAVRAVSRQAVEVAYESVVNAEVQRLLFSQDELAPDEI